MRSSRHAPVKKAILFAMRKLGGTSAVPTIEPDLRTIWREKESYLQRRRATPAAQQQPLHHMQEHPGTPPTAPPPHVVEDLPGEATAGARADWANKPRGDIVWKAPQGTVVYDLVITHPLPRSSQQTAQEAGTAANEAHNDKINKYTRRFEIPGGEFLPIAVETGGRLHPMARAAFKTFVRTTLGIDPAEPVPPDMAYKYQLAMRTILDSLAVSLAREVAIALLSGGSGGREPAVPRQEDLGGQ